MAMTGGRQDGRFGVRMTGYIHISHLQGTRSGGQTHGILLSSAIRLFHSGRVGYR
jgi:hypothetical protein